jgi:hypothetical protein
MKTQKLFLFLGLILLGQTGFADRYVIGTNGGAGGYDIVTSEYPCGSGNTCIKCMQPGNNACPFAINPQNPTPLEYLFLAAYDNILQQKLTGRVTNGQQTVTWTAQDPYNFEISGN